MVLENDDASGGSWTALMAAVAFTLAEMDYSPPERRTAAMFLQRMDELLKDSFQHFQALTLDEEQDALRLAQAMRRTVQSVRDSIRSEYGDP